MWLKQLLKPEKPAGVGIGKKPPVYLNFGDTITVSVTGLGTLTNRIGDPTSTNPIVAQVASSSHLEKNNASKSIESTMLTQINNKHLYYRSLGQTSGPPVVFVHGLGGSAEFYTPLIHSLRIAKSHSLHLLDLEGHGLSPTSPLSKLSIESFAADLNGLFEKANITSGATLVAHSMGCLVAVQFALKHPDKISKLILIGPPPSPLSEAGSAATYARAETVRTKGVASVVEAIVTAGTSEKSQTSNPLAITAVRMSLLSQDPEGYAKGCAALADANGIDFAAIQARTLIVTGSEDRVSPPQLCEKYVKELKGNARLQVLENVGHWHIFEDSEGVANAVETFL
jgi:pimeloyl-ACP methyl ester carboxylesterase